MLDGFVNVTKYNVVDRIGKGGFSEVYLGYHVYKPKKVAIKISPKIEGTNTLVNEARIMLHLQRVATISMPRILKYGTYDFSYNYIVMDLLGETVYHKKLPKDADPVIHYVIHIMPMAMQLVDAFRAIHAAGFVYRDVKPSNFLFGVPPNDDRVYVVDFGLVKQYASARQDARVSPAGTVSYMSMRTHEGMEQTPRDDMESLGYLLLHLVHGDLPWRGCSTQETLSKKSEDIKTIPNLKKYIDIARNIDFNDMPNYRDMKSLLSCISITE